MARYGTSMGIIRITAEQPNVDMIVVDLAAVTGLQADQIEVHPLTPSPGELGNADWSTIIIDLAVATGSGLMVSGILEGVKAVIARARRRGHVIVELPGEEGNRRGSTSGEDCR